MLCCFLHLSLQLHETCSLPLHACILSFFFSKIIPMLGGVDFCHQLSDTFPTASHQVYRFMYGSVSFTPTPHPRMTTTKTRWCQTASLHRSQVFQQSSHCHQLTAPRTVCIFQRGFLRRNTRWINHRPRLQLISFPPISFFLQNWTSQLSHDAIRSQLGEL